MQISKNKVNKNLDTQIANSFYKLVTDINSPKEAELIFKDLLSETEIITVVKRLAVGYWLTNKRSYEIIKNTLKVSSATIATIQQDLKKPGWKAAIKKVMAEEWATKWEAKIKNLLKI